VSDDFLKKIFQLIDKNPKTEIVIDLQNQTIDVDNLKEKFEINAYKKTCLINGYDDIDYLLSLNKEVRDFDLAHT
jgi:3-isopropylmalate/(R)-2-methylmalate dehydratase small subunit